MFSARSAARSARPFSARPVLLELVLLVHECAGESLPREPLSPGPWLYPEPSALSLAIQPAG